MPAHGQSPQVSVIVRSMARQSLGAALASIAAQEGVVAEVVVVAACGAAHPAVAPTCGPHPVSFIPSAMRLPRPAAANAGLAAARGEWITFLDDDDVFLRDHLVGLVAAARQAPRARVISSYARLVFVDGRVEWVGQPYSLVQLYSGNYVHLSASIFARALVAAGCRFDESLAILEDWDFMLQLAQHGPFHFVPLGSFQWNADAGDSGAGAGSNRDEKAFVAHRDRVYAKWLPAFDALCARTDPLLDAARALLANGRLAQADAKACEALAASPNDPFALALRAAILRAAGRLADARSVQAFAASVRPADAAFVYNLALLDRAAGDVDAARRNAGKALARDPGHVAARMLLAELG